MELELLLKMVLFILFIYLNFLPSFKLPTFKLPSALHYSCSAFHLIRYWLLFQERVVMGIERVRRVGLVAQEKLKHAARNTKLAAMLVYSLMNISRESCNHGQVIICTFTA